MTSEGTDSDRKLLDSLERLGEAFNSLKGKIAREHGLSSLQVRVLLYLMDRSDEGHNNSSLGRSFGLTRATMGETVRSLCEKELVERAPSRKDRRSYELELTRRGISLSEQLAGYSRIFKRPLSQLEKKEKESLIRSIHLLLHGMIQEGIVSVQRMCYTCRFYRQENGKGHCDLLDLSMEEPRMDCKVHETANENSL